MRKDFLRVVLAGLFTLSVGAAGAVFAAVRSVQPLATCPSCSIDLGCPGSTCNCKYDKQTAKYYCGVC